MERPIWTDESMNERREMTMEMEWKKDKHSTIRYFVGE